MIAPSYDAGSGGRAQRCRVHVIIAQAVRRQRVQVRRLNEATETAQMPKTSIIKDNEQHIRCAWFSAQRCRPSRTRLIPRPSDDAGERSSRFILNHLRHLRTLLEQIVNFRYKPLEDSKHNKNTRFKLWINDAGKSDSHLYMRRLIRSCQISHVQ